MTVLTLEQKYLKARYEAFRWRHSLAATKKLGLAFLMAALMAVLAQVRVALPWTPVPLTGSTFGVIFAGILLGNYWGGISVLIYVMLGVAGLPVFTGYNSGAAVLAGPTAGYIFGYALTAFAIGYITDTYEGSRKFLPLFTLMFVSSMVILACGSGFLGYWLGAVKGRAASAGEVMWMGFMPFVPGDTIKSLAAAAIASAILPKGRYN